MSADLYAKLSWLPDVPQDFSVRNRAILSSAKPGVEIQALANHALGETELIRLSATIARLTSEGRSLAPLQNFRLGVLGNSTVDLLLPVLTASAARHGFALTCVQTEFGQFLHQAIDPASHLNQSRPDAVLLVLDHRGLPLDFDPGNLESEALAISGAIKLLDTIRSSIRANSGAISIVQTIAAPPETLFGSLDRVIPGSERHLIDNLNRAIAASVASTEDVLLDVAGLAETVGLADWHSPEQWNLAKLPFDGCCLPIYGEYVARLLSAIRGRSRKCLILDLDNTVWGGVIGDDGLEGIKIAQGDAIGEAHLAVQKLALSLRKRGVVLAVSSKNTDSVARKPFREHPEMLLKEDHFAVFQANWNDKATNIKAIAEELSLGLDSIVFLDDNPVERELVRRTLPQVAVPEVPEDPALFARTLSAAGYFESVAFSKEDKARAEMYQSNARRATLQGQVTDLESYLASLEMVIIFSPFDLTGRARIAQLINKSNQFNLTTRRYTEAEVAAAENDPSVFALQVRLIDKFGDNGMISVLICRPNGPGAWFIDTWLMSCRVLGRKVEQMVLREIIENARAAGVSTLHGAYLPTEKNKLVEHHYANLGFEKVDERADGSTFWALSTATEVPATKMVVQRPPE